MNNIEIEALRAQVRARGAGGDPGLSRPLTGGDALGDPTYQMLRHAGCFKNDSPNSASAINAKLSKEDLNRAFVALAGIFAFGFAAMCAVGWTADNLVFGLNAEQNRAQIVRALSR